MVRPRSALQHPSTMALQLIGEGSLHCFAFKVFAI
jgi:hypothetical protein